MATETETRPSIENVPRDQPWTMTLPASDWSRILRMMGYWLEEDTGCFYDFESKPPKQINALDIFERFYIQAGLIEDAPDSFAIGSTRYHEHHSKCETACGMACPKYKAPRKKRNKIT